MLSTNLQITAIVRLQNAGGFYTQCFSSYGLLFTHPPPLGGADAYMFYSVLFVRHDSA